MELVEKYIEKHREYVDSVFKSMAKGDTVEATKVLNFIQSAFNK